MCGRYANDIQDVERWTGVLGDWPYDVDVGYNIAPSQTVPVVTNQGGRGMRWGLIPEWSRDGSAKYATFNARLESAAEKPTFRTPWQKSQTCLVPALGYYEWCLDAGRKQPFFVHHPSGEPLVFAGLWDAWQSGSSSLLSCTILTQPSSGRLFELHPRMPVMLDVPQAECWLRDGTGSLDGEPGLFVPTDLGMYPVSPRVNHTRQQGADLAKPMKQPDQELPGLFEGMG